MITQEETIGKLTKTIFHSNQQIQSATNEIIYQCVAIAVVCIKNYIGEEEIPKELFCVACDIAFNMIVEFQTQSDSNVSSLRQGDSTVSFFTNTKRETISKIMLKYSCALNKYRKMAF